MSKDPIADLAARLHHATEKYNDTSLPLDERFDWHEKAMLLRRQLNKLRKEKGLSTEPKEQ